MNDLIARYVEAASASVPENQRSELRREIRNAINELVEPRMESGEAESTAIRSSLESLGDPRQLAASYLDTPRYLIGPGWFPLYVDVLKRLLPAAVIIVFAVFAVLDVLDNSTSLFNAMLTGVGAAWSVGLQILLWTTIGFYIAERSVGPHPDADKTSPWEVDDLPEATVSRQIGLGETISTVLVLGLFGVVAFLQQTRGLGFLFNRDKASDWQVQSLINPDLGAGWIVSFIALIVISIAVAVLGYMGRTYNLRFLILAIVENIAWIVFAVALAISTPIFNRELAREIGDTSPDRWGANQQANWMLALVMIGWSVWEIWEAWRNYERNRTERDLV